MLFGDCNIKNSNRTFTHFAVFIKYQLANRGEQVKVSSDIIKFATEAVLYTIADL